jgi:uncharacterized C2H2 Zn-finger protein
MVEPLLVCPQAGKLVKEEFKYSQQRNHPAAFLLQKRIYQKIKIVPIQAGVYVFV